MCRRMKGFHLEPVIFDDRVDVNIAYVDNGLSTDYTVVTIIFVFKYKTGLIRFIKDFPRIIILL